VNEISKEIDEGKSRENIRKFTLKANRKWCIRKVYAVLKTRVTYSMVLCEDKSRRKRPRNCDAGKTGTKYLKVFSADKLRTTIRKFAVNVNRE